MTYAQQSAPARVGDSTAAPGKPTGPVGAVKGKGSHIRRDVQGLRALAVLVIIVQHIWYWPKGGFTAVEVFFVISGYMITGLLLREQAKTGTISFSLFYRRRARRLLPASIAVLLATAALAKLIFSEARFRETIGDTIAAFFFAGNWRFASKESDYFTADGPISPLRHFWTLAVEEQFYVLWPVLLLLAALLAKRLGARRLLIIGVVLGGLVLASLSWGLAESQSNASLAYYSTFSRAWELGVGALVAVWVARPTSRVDPRLRRPGTMLGIAGIFASFFLVSEGSGFPVPWGLLSVLSTALILVAGHGGKQTRNELLTNEPMVKIGDLSYSIYLWHFPVIVFGREYYDIESPQGSIAAIVVMFVVAYFAYHLLENPIHRSNWLEPRGHGRARKPFFTPTYRRRAIAAVVVAGLGLTAFVYRPIETTDPSALRPGVVGSVPGAADQAVSAVSVQNSAVSQLQAQIDTALAATDWPELTPSLDEVISGSWISDSDRACGGAGPVPESCVWGPVDAPKTAVIVGDSIALSYSEALRGVFAQHPEWRFYSYASFGCTFTATRTRVSGPTNTARCPEEKQQTLEFLAEKNPDLVLITNRYGKRTDYAKDRFMTPAEWKASQLKMAKKIAGDVGTIAYLAPPPSDTDIATCYNQVNKPADCVSRVTQEWTNVAAVEAAVADLIPDAVWVDTRALFCDLDRGLCPAFVGGVAVKPDRSHVAQAYGAKIAPALDELLQEAGLL